MKTMRFSAAVVLCILGILMICAADDKNHQTASPPNKRVVIATRRLLDGRGHILPETRLVVEGSKIVRLDPKAEPVDYDLRRFTVLPGWIDAHVHITWSF